jgi:hypothetical protein
MRVIKRLYSIGQGKQRRNEATSGNEEAGQINTRKEETLTGTSIEDNSRDSVVGIATGYRLDDYEVGVRILTGSRITSSSRRPERCTGARPASYPMGTGDSSPLYYSICNVTH